jgi:hypothetical protein
MKNMTQRRKKEVAAFTHKERPRHCPIKLFTAVIKSGAL